MDTTRASLLVRVRDRNDDEAWRQFLGLYKPLLFRYARARGFPDADAKEVRDACLEAIARNIATFEYDKQRGGFKAWLRRIAENKAIDLMRRRRTPIADTQELHALADAQPSPAELWEQHWRREHLKYCVDQVGESVSETSLRVFKMLLFEAASVKEICDQLNLTRNQVYKAKAQVLDRVRQKLAEFE